jgi:phosphoserine/homoserine phosphotransferase
MNLVCLDLEGVLIPEIWIAFAEKTGLQELRRTTRDEPDYDKLMRYRLEILARHQFTLTDIQDVIGTLELLPDALEFYQWLRSRAGVVILSDTFMEFAWPLMAKLDYPTLFCHNLVVDDQKRIVNYQLRMRDQKRAAVEAFRKLNFRVLASGDSYNDLSMIQAADRGFFFCPPDSMVREYPDYPVARDHAQLKALLEPHL